MDAFELKKRFDASPERLYEAWTDPTQLAAFTEAAATGEPYLGGEFTAWDGYITGRYLELVPGVKLRFAWRTTEFPRGAPDSQVEITLERRPKGTQLVLRHTGIPDGQGGNYKQGWKDYYFEPLRIWLALQ